MSEKNNPKEKAAQGEHTKAAKQNRHRHYHPNSLYAQRHRIMEWFKTCNRLTTEQARRLIDVMHPAGRIKELRARGFEILTMWENYPTDCGELHRMACYVFMGMRGRDEK